MTAVIIDDTQFKFIRCLNDDKEVIERYLQGPFDVINQKEIARAIYDDSYRAYIGRNAPWQRLPSNRLGFTTLMYLHFSVEETKIFPYKMWLIGPVIITGLPHGLTKEQEIMLNKIREKYIGGALVEEIDSDSDYE